MHESGDLLVEGDFSVRELPCCQIMVTQQCRSRESIRSGVVRATALSATEIPLFSLSKNKRRGIDVIGFDPLDVLSVVLGIVSELLRRVSRDYFTDLS